MDDRPSAGTRSTSSGRRALIVDAADVVEASGLVEVVAVVEAAPVVRIADAVDPDAEKSIEESAGCAPETALVESAAIEETPHLSRRAAREARSRVASAVPEPAKPRRSARPAVAARPATSRALERSSHPHRVAGHAKRFTAVTASTASVGLAMSLMFALPADAAQPSTLSPAALQTIVDSNGHTAAQILDVSSNVTMPALQRDNQIAAALTGIVSQEADGPDIATAQAAISNALQYGGARTTIVETALSYLGDPYVLDGASHSGIDCSGLVMVAYQAVGIHLAHLVSAQDAVATPITEAEALPGDVVIFNDDAHIGIYLGNGLLIQAPKPGTPVDIVPVWTIPHHFARILPAGE